MKSLNIIREKKIIVHDFRTDQMLSDNRSYTFLHKKSMIFKGKLLLRLDRHPMRQILLREESYSEIDWIQSPTFSRPFHHVRLTVDLQWGSLDFVSFWNGKNHCT